MSKKIVWIVLVILLIGNLYGFYTVNQLKKELNGTEKMYFKGQLIQNTQILSTVFAEMKQNKIPNKNFVGLIIFAFPYHGVASSNEAKYVTEMGLYYGSIQNKIQKLKSTNDISHLDLKSINQLEGQISHLVFDTPNLSIDTIKQIDVLVKKLDNAL